MIAQNRQASQPTGHRGGAGRCRPCRAVGAALPCRQHSPHAGGLTVLADGVLVKITSKLIEAGYDAYTAAGFAGALQAVTVRSEAGRDTDQAPARGRAARGGEPDRLIGRGRVGSRGLAPWRSRYRGGRPRPRPLPESAKKLSPRNYKNCPAMAAAQRTLAGGRSFVWSVGQTVG